MPAVQEQDFHAISHFTLRSHMITVGFLSFSLSCGGFRGVAAHLGGEVGS